MPRHLLRPAERARTPDSRYTIDNRASGPQEPDPPATRAAVPAKLQSTGAYHGTVIVSPVWTVMESEEAGMKATISDRVNRVDHKADQRVFMLMSLTTSY